MEAHLNVRTAVETLMKDGVTEKSDEYRKEEFPNVKITTEKEPLSDPYYHVTVSDRRTKLTVDTYVRDASPKGGGT